MWPYLAFLACTVASDSLPVVGPPVWTIMVLFWTEWDLNPWILLPLGVAGSTLGRFVFSLYGPRVSERLVRRRKNEELAEVARKLEGSLWRSWLFVFLYAVTPLSTTVLFLAVGLGRVHARLVLPPFFLGKLVLDGILMVSGRYAVRSISDLVHGTVSWKGLGATAAGIIVIALFMFIDWRSLLERRRLRLSVHILK